MKVRPILFNSLMVESILDEDKTATRRIVKPQPSGETTLVEFNIVEQAFVPWRWTGNGGSRTGKVIECPYGQAGDGLWVRESCWVLGWWKRNGDTPTGRDAWRFVTDPSHQVRFSARPRGDQCTKLAGPIPGWCRRPSIHMPRWASRLLLEVTAVRYERLQAISQSDALAEGVCMVPFYPDEGFPRSAGYMLGHDDDLSMLHPEPIGAFSAGWDAMHGAGAWERNDWVWVIEFKNASPVTGDGVKENESA